MEKPLELTFKSFEDKNGAVTQVVHEKLAKLEQICPKLTSCHVVIEQFQNPKHRQHSYSIHIVVTFPPHHEVIILREPQKGQVQDALLTTQVRDAFIAARRKVQDILDKHQGKIKMHESENAVLDEEPDLELEGVE